MIIGVTGTDGGGKGAVVEYLVTQKGFMHCSARQLFLDEIYERKLEPSRANMRLVANSLRAEHGNDYLIREYFRRTGYRPKEKYIIESVRTLAEADALREYGGVLWVVDANQKLRFERIQTRASESDKITFEEFLAQEALEMNDPDPHGMQKAKVMAAADVTILNEGTFEELHARVDEALAKLS